jgi:hypothetical protein
MGNHVIRVTTTVEIIDDTHYNQPHITSGTTFSASTFTHEGGNRLYVANIVARQTALLAESLTRKVEADYGVCPLGSVAVILETRYPEGEQQ